jgi:uncharacterized membrane protein YbaN (DUF454 family)
MSEAAPNYRKKQAFLVMLVFLCIVAAFLIPQPTVVIGVFLLAIAICLIAAKTQPEPVDDHHHH